MNVLDRVKERIARTRAVACAGVLLCVIGLVAVTLAVFAHYSLLAWGIVGALFLAGVSSWLFPLQTSAFWGFTGIVRRKQNAFESFFMGLARTDGPTADELREQIGGGTLRTQKEFIEPHIEKLTNSIHHYENIEEHRHTRKHLLCLAGSMLTVFSFLAVHVPSSMVEQQWVASGAPGGEINQTVHTNGPPEKVAKRVKEVIPSAKETPSPGGPQIRVPEGTPAPPQRLDVAKRGNQLAVEFSKFMQDAKQYGIDLADPAKDVKARKGELITRGEALQRDYEQLAEDANKLGMSETAGDATELAKSAKKTTDEIRETKPEETDPEKRKADSESFLDSLKEILKKIKELLDLAKEVWDAIKKIFPDLGGSSDGGGAGGKKEGGKKEGGKDESGEGAGKESKDESGGSSKPGDGSSKPSKESSGSADGTTKPSPTKADTTITFSPKGTPLGTTGPGGGGSTGRNTSGAGKVEGETSEPVQSDPTEPG